VTTATGSGEVARLPAGRRAVLYAVRRRGEATAEQVAEQLDITVSGARQPLTALAKEGRVESGELPSGQPSEVYIEFVRANRARFGLPS